VTPSRYALLFPGQGAQFLGMGQRWHDRLPLVRELFDLAEERTGLPLRDLCFRTPRDVQARTDLTQPCVFVASLACWMGLQDALAWHDLPYAPVCIGGHSLGHFTALVSAGALDIGDGLDLVRRRGEIMYEEGRRRAGGMATVLGLDHDRVSGIVAEEGGDLVSLAAVNGPDQFVVSGDLTRLRCVVAAAERAGAERVVTLSIGIAAHSPLMAAAQDQFAAELATIRLAPPRLPVVLETAAGVTDDPDQIRLQLTGHMTRPVLWWESIQQVRQAGALQLVDVGPGRTLSRMLHRHLPESEVISGDQPHAVTALLR